MSSYPFVFEEIKDEKERKRLFAEGSVNRGPVRSLPGGLLHPRGFKNIAADIYCGFELRPDDVWIVSWPRCGNTWTSVSLFHIERKHVQ